MLDKRTIAVQCEGIRKIFYAGNSEVAALKGIDITVFQGELFMLVGPSGCGKTTLISVIAGILNQTSGRCVVFGTSLNDLAEEDRTAFRGRNIGFVFQAYNLIPSLTVSENIAIPLVLNGSSFEEAVSNAAQMLEKVDMSEKADAYPAQLSGGQQQRVAICRALVHNPKLIVCDEPTAALDHENGQRIMDLFKQVARDAGVTLIVVTHDPRIFSYADRIAKLDDGELEKIVDSAEQL